MIEKTGIDVVLHREADGAVVRVPVVGEVGGLGARARLLGGDADSRPGPPEVHAEELRARLRELWEDELGLAVEDDAVVEDADLHVLHRTRGRRQHERETEE